MDATSFHSVIVVFQTHLPFWQNTAKTRHFGKITAFTAFDENHSFRDFRVSVIIYCPWLKCKIGGPGTICGLQVSVTRLRDLFSGV